MSAVAFADDLALKLDVASQEEMGDRLGRGMSMVTRWCVDNGPTIAHDKTGVILLAEKHISKLMEIDMVRYLLRTKQETLHATDDGKFDRDSNQERGQLE